MKPYEIEILENCICELKNAESEAEISATLKPFELRSAIKCGSLIARIKITTIELSTLLKNQ